MNVTTSSGRSGPVGVIGAGVMGSGIAQAFATAGTDVVCRDVDTSVLETAKTRTSEGRFGFDRAVSAGKLTRNEADDAIGRLKWTTELADLADCALVVECVPEDPDLKRRVIAEVCSVVASDTIVATNTSGFSVASLRDACPNPGRFLAWHWASPAAISKLAEIVVAPSTDDEVVELVREVAAALGRNPVVVKDDPTAWGFVANRVYGAMLAEAHRVVEAGISSPDDVDRLMMDTFGWPSGPFGMVRGAATGWED